MTLHPLQLLNEEVYRPLVQEDEEQETEHEGRCWTFAKNIFRVSRRYSIVATEVSLLVLNLGFLITKFNDDIPPEADQVILALLSTVGVVSLHYYSDIVWKSVQDTRFAIKVSNYPITALAGTKVVQVTSNIALTLGNFYAAMQGVSGNVAGQTTSYHNMILWGEISLGTGLALVLLSLYATWHTKKQINQEQIDFDPRIAANIRFCMDKDTLWHLIDQLKNLDEDDQEALENALQVVQKNIDTQLKVTLGGRLVLILTGDALQAIEKVYTPNSKVSAVINCFVSVAYAIKISVEKGLEYYQRGDLDQL